MVHMKIIVTGGAGFIASHVVDQYIQDGHQVAVIDNLATGFKKNINSRAKFYLADIKDTKKINRIFQAEKPDIVNHHAAIAEVVKSLRDPMPTFNVNINGTVNLLFASGQNQVKKFIFSSTGGAIYGEPDKIPADEGTEPTPLSPYGLSKYVGEIFIKFYAQMYGFNYLIFRYPNVYGPRQNPKGEAGIIAIFGGLIKTGKRPTIFGDGTKTRDYVYVKDIVQANSLALTKGEDVILNLGWGEEISDQEIFDAIAKNESSTKEVKYKPFRQGEVLRIAISNFQAKKTLGWSPKTKLTEGIKETLSNLN